MRKKSKAAKMLRLVFILFLFSFLWSCGGVNYFDLFIEPSHNDPAKTIDRVLRVEQIRSNDILLDQRIIFRKNTYQVEYFPFKLWAKRADELIQDTVFQYYKSSAYFIKVVDEYSSVEPDLVMRIHIDSLEIIQERREWFAHLALDIELFDAKSEKTLFNHSFDRKMRIESKNPRLVPEKISLILKEELLKVIIELNEIKKTVQ